jgi:hypothetical protein
MPQSAWPVGIIRSERSWSSGFIRICRAWLLTKYLYDPSAMEEINVNGY